MERKVGATDDREGYLDGQLEAFVELAGGHVIRGANRMRAWVFDASDREIADAILRKYGAESAARYMQAQAAHEK